MSVELKKTPALRLYIPLGVALLLTLATIFLSALAAEFGCSDLHGVDCKSYLPEFGVICAAIFVAIFVSLFAFRKIIILTVSTLVVLWNFYFLVLMISAAYHANFFSIILAEFVTLPALVAAGITIYRCLRPKTKGFWEDWRLGD
jgi:hypothetical protein